MRKRKQALTENELTLLKFIHDSFSNREIAIVTGKSRKTVERTLSKVYRFLDVKSRYDAAMWYHSFGRNYGLVDK